MDQFKEISTMRSEVDKVLQEQRLEKIRRDFEKQKYEDERRFKYEKWLEDQKRAILEAKLRNAANQPLPPSRAVTAMSQPMSLQSHQQPPPPLSRGPSQPSQFQPPPPSAPQTAQSNKTAGRFAPTTKQEEDEEDRDPNKYYPEVGFNLCIDFATKVARQFRSMRLVYAVYNVHRPIVNPSLIEVHDGEPDPEDAERNRVFFNTSHTLKNIKPHPSANLVIEMQVPKPQTSTGDKFISFGWTVINLFDTYYELNKGKFRLPSYMSPTKVEIDVRDIASLKRIPETEMCVRIATPGDVFSGYRVVNTSHSHEYTVPAIH